MIWLFTRAMISSTTCPDASAGRHAKAVRTRQSFFIEYVGPSTLPGPAGKGGLGPIPNILLLCSRTGRPSIYSFVEALSLRPWQAAELAGGRIRVLRTRASAVRSSH